jgi:CheY-like chemotaxis protein
MSKILVIEDETSIRRVLTKILSEENNSYEVDEAVDGLAGYEKIKQTDYDLVLCDIKMPKMDGVELLEAVKKIKPRALSKGRHLLPMQVIRRNGINRRRNRGRGHRRNGHGYWDGAIVLRSISINERHVLLFQAAKKFGHFGHT